MKNNIIFSITLLAFLVACGPTDKNAQLEALKQKEKEISAQIKELEAELAVDTDNETAEPDKEITPVKIAEVGTKPFAHYISLQGKIDSDNNIMLGSKASGTITKVNVKEGDKVSKGQVLAEIDAKILQANLVELKNSLNLANTLYERQKNLWEQNIGTEVQYLQAKNNKESLEQKLASLREQIELTKIVAPFSGTVDAVMIKKGEVAAPGMPAIRIINPSDYTLQAELSENYINSIQESNKVLIELPSGGKKFTSRIKSLSSVIDPVNRTFTVEVAIPDSLNDYVKANMIAFLHIQDYQNENAVVIPINAVNFSGNSPFVFVAENNVAKKQTISTGKTFNNNIEVLSGLNAGDQLIVAGHKNITEGEAVSY